MVCYHYPPVAGSSGFQRTLNFVRQLPKVGWQPLVLTVHPRAYPQTGGDALQADTGGAPVIRAFALDAARHLSIKGRYPSFAAWPDRWASWWFGAVALAARRVRSFAPHLIWSTYPIATAHWIGAAWSRFLGRPWIADFRDPMSEDNYPDPIAGRLVRRIERTAVTRAWRVVTVTDGAAKVLREDHPDVPPDRFITIPNGFDEAAFLEAERSATQPAHRARFELIHSGILYSVERDPRPFFQALRELLNEGVIGGNELHVTLRATGHDEIYRPLIAAAGLQQVVSLEKSLPYAQALAEMLSADGLILFQGAICNHQVPAKVYEYLRAQRPILALTDPAGDTAGVLRICGLDEAYRLESVSEVKQGIARFISNLRSRSARIAPRAQVDQFSRAGQTAALARVFDAAVAT
jgi:glycosyl transferase family 4